jgi:glycosyltransferase involved in cell wall biosynthesis
MITISIVTPSYNRAGLIGRALQSVREQGVEDLEHIVVDGGSTDGTLQVVKQFPSVRLVCEPDLGVYDALNKGIRLAGGTIIGQLNTDDYYGPGVLKEVGDLFSRHPNLDAVVGGAQVFETDQQGNETTAASYPPIRVNELADRAILGVPIFNAWFFRRELFERVGFYSLEFPIVADRDFLIRCYLSRINFMSVESIFYHYRRHQNSLSISNDRSSQIPLRRDTLHLAEKYMRSQSSDRTVKRLAMQRHDWTSAELMMSLLRGGRLFEALHVMRAAIRYNPLWLLTVTFAGLKRIKGILKGKNGASS